MKRKRATERCTRSQSGKRGIKFCMVACEVQRIKCYDQKDSGIQVGKLIRFLAVLHWHVWVVKPE